MAGAEGAQPQAVADDEDRGEGAATAPTGGAYRLFLDFKHQGTVRTAAFTLPTSPASPTSPAAIPRDQNHTGAEHH
ncbi:hypothetical protein AVW11_30335 [Streptomyces amritsarensis]|uniref:Uncharacterized protein n=1 Tax=Streptomyces amritsarensis TaxID=681158 RepID=A0ABX3FTZ8_9ACTN|nr:hypothetical protein AVW11_30335 [Streptomyces amritsarensis]